MFVYNIHISEAHLNIPCDTSSVSSGVISGCFNSVSHLRLLCWPLSTAGHKGCLCVSHSIQVLAYMVFTMGNIKMNGTPNNEINVKVCWRHGSFMELTKQSALSRSGGVRLMTAQKWPVETHCVSKAKHFGQRGNRRRKNMRTTQRKNVHDCGIHQGHRDENKRPSHSEVTSHNTALRLYGCSTYSQLWQKTNNTAILSQSEAPEMSLKYIVSITVCNE